MKILLVADMNMVTKLDDRSLRPLKEEFNSSLFLGHIMKVSSIYLHI